INKGNYSINSFITSLFPFETSFLASKWPRSNKRQCPPLKLIPISFCEMISGCHIRRKAVNHKLNPWKHGFKAVLLERNRKDSNVNAYPLPAKLLTGSNSSPATAEWV